jgi:hypothetical protein
MHLVFLLRNGGLKKPENTICSLKLKYGQWASIPSSFVAADDLNILA